jgi:hypothetical protein
MRQVGVTGMWVVEATTFGELTREAYVCGRGLSRRMLWSRLKKP